MEKIINKLNQIKAGQKLRIAQQKGLAKIEIKAGHQMVLGYRQYLPSQTKKTKRALVSYVVQPVIDELSGVSTTLFSNSGAGRTIPKVLNELGYIVDIIDWDDTRPVQGEYDLVIFHGGKNFEQIKKLKSPANKLVYYSTGSYWQYHNNQELKRQLNFKERHGKTLLLDREIKDSEEPANKNSDAIIVLGNKDAAKTYSNFNNVFNLEGASMPIAKPRFIKPMVDGKVGILFIAGPGNLHKGLDIILDAWQKLPNNFELHIITYMDPEYEKFYHKALYETNNIVTHGYVRQRSKEFYKIISKCQYSLLLSCSEGSPGSVIESMHQGLIPIVSKESHIDLPPEGFIIESIEVDMVAKELSRLIKSDPKNTIEQQEKVRKWANAKFDMAVYEYNFAKIIGRITK